MALFLWTSFYGLNFGYHWDENRSKFDAVKDSLNTGIFLQGSTFRPEGGNYNYGGLNYLLTWSALTPEIIHFLLNGPYNLNAYAQQIEPILYGSNVRIRVRVIYTVLTALTIVWVLCLNVVLRRSSFEAFLAAAILAGSWEVAYHARWVAPDGVMMQFAWLGFLCLAIAMHTRVMRWLYLGAVAIGLAVGTKYPGVLVLPFFIVGAAQMLWHKRYALAFAVKHIAGLTATTGIVFVFTTPGAVLDPFRFLYQTRVQEETYSTGWYGFSVTPGMAHLGDMLHYFAREVFSHFWPISIVLALFCALGILSLIAERRLLIWLAAGFCLVYMIYFAQQSAMIVRNLLIIAPFLAIAGARGVVVAGERLGLNARVAFHSMIVSLVAVNLGWEVYAAREIKVRFHPEHYMNKFAAYTRTEAHDRFLVSAKLSDALSRIQAPVGTNIVRDPTDPYTKVAFFQSEGPDRTWQLWPSNAWGLYTKMFGPLEVNLEAYSTFLGSERILVVTSAAFKSLPLNASDLVGP